MIVVVVEDGKRCPNVKPKTTITMVKQELPHANM